MGSLELFSLLPFLLFALVAAGEIEELNTYVVHVQPKENHVFGTPSDRKEWHQSFLPDNDRLVHSYHHVASGFAARLTRRELDAVSAMPGFVAAVPDVIYRLQTTHTPQFLGLNTALGYRNPSVGSGDGVIIGVLDTGVFPNHPSFSGKGMPPPPAKWKGRCDFNASACNNKLIGARSFISEGSSSGGPPTDEEGHGTHTSSTAAGAVVPGAQVLGQANGTASGMAPRAHLAMYKVCSEDGCASVDILAGIDAAVSDGCDVISMSLGGESVPFYHDSIAVGTFAAAEKGIFVSMAAGNSGPNYTTLSNDAPWMLTVAASTMDRLISAQVILGDGLSFDGESVYQPDSVEAPLVYAGASSTPLAQFCGNGSLDGFDVKNKIVLCERGGDVGRVDKGIEVLRAGGAGMILTNEFIDGYSLLADAHVLPASHVSYAAGVEIKNYIKCTPNCTAKISFRGTVLGTSPAPAITSFSSRGPSTQNMDILKPDITGPGVSVLAAWPFKVGPPTCGFGMMPPPAKPTFNILSGTSMSTPHLAGVAALIKSKHPDWSPAAIKSAIMTTADVTDRSGTLILDEQHKTADLFAVGAGHVNPEKAVDPGLVFDAAAEDYIGYLCGMYTNQQVSVIARRAVDCSAVKVIREYQLNYPSISLRFPQTWSPTFVIEVDRTVKNVGEVPATYHHQVDMPADSPVSVGVFPSSLLFAEADQVQKLQIFVWATNSSATAVQGALLWVSEKHTVRIPISVTFAAE
ncbi:hypothetical protein CFC21_019492 [Triticum aestivum]|uniref:Subtilisin-like protease n=2 Tax=Triticum aestivum TaxID=4565 RepID=A0A9R1E5L8_WHEAT|nr:hypothetical protein CFC21_019492 [Triticum aestivum]